MPHLFSKKENHKVAIIKRTIKVFFCFVCLPLLFSNVLILHPVLATEEKKEILIGSHLPLSGALAMAGAEQKWAYERAVEDVNKMGGIYVVEYGKKLPVRLIVMDDETNPGMAAAVVERLIKGAKVDLLLSGCTGAHGVIPGMITAEKYRTYYHGSVLWVSDFLKHNFKWCTMYFFDMAQGGALGFEVWDSLPEDQRPKKPAVFEEDTFDGKQLGDLWIVLAEKYGYRIALRESMGMMVGAKDFTPQILRAKAAGVDAILLMANTADTVTLVRQMKQNKFSVKFFHGWKGTWETEFYQTLEKDADYIFCDGFWSEDYPFKGAKELGKRYYEEFGKRSVGIGLYYALCQILWQALEKAGTLDGAKIRRAVLDNVFETVNGTVDYDKRGIALFPLAEFQWWNGKQEIVYPLEYSQLQAMLAPPWDER
jgi:branched-chain amino acid transport system substrate-binding protein